MRKPALPAFRLVTDHGFTSDPYTLDPSAPAAPGGLFLVYIKGILYPAGGAENAIYSIYTISPPQAPIFFEFLH